MQLYLFPHLTDAPVISALLDLREGEGPAPGLHAGLLDFACRRGCTRETLREYVVCRLIDTRPACWQRTAMLPYLVADTERLYDTLFTPDWDAACAEAGLLPLPRLMGGAVAAEPAYRALMAGMVHAGSPAAFCGQLAGFFDAYQSGGEAMYRAFRWDGALRDIPHPAPTTFDDLRGLEHQKATLIDNTRAFMSGRPANNVLLVGGSGTGKSSCVKAALNHFADEGLKLVEFAHADLGRLPELMAELATSCQRYIVFIDDLSFEGSAPRYLALKTALDGQMAERPANVLIYATSNRRHLVRETWKDRAEEEDIHQNDTVHEKLSLSERFGIRLYFAILSAGEYLDIVHMLLTRSGVTADDETDRQALVWAAENSGRSGRTAQQFAVHYLGTL